MSVLSGLLLLVGSSLLLWLAMLGLALARKLRRDRRELRSADRRARYAEVFGTADVAAIAATFTGAEDDEEAQIDLAISIDAGHETLKPADFEAIGRGMEASSLRSRLIADLGSGRALTRARAAFLLSRPGTSAAVEQIAPLLGDPDPDVRLVACSGLARAATPRAAEVLIAGLAAEVLPPERIIERLGAPWAVETILAALESGPTASDASLVRALGLAADPRAAGPLAELLRSDSVEVRISAARSLGRVGAPACVPALVTALSSEVWAVRAQAAKSLGTLGAAEALQPLERCLSDRAWWVRANAARALRELGDPGLEVLREAVEHEDRYAADRAREQLALHAVLVEQAAA
ncbi:MAG: HEAT repeat domain-containing protein [Actinobacteria bacterium]|nr:HEAT repeat domain-containing protein [Actinomycetota bacterium]